MAEEGRGGGGNTTDEDLSLPRATVQKLISGEYGSLLSAQPIYDATHIRARFD